MSRKVQIAVIAVLVLLCCCLALLAAGSVLWTLVPQTPTPEPLVAHTPTAYERTAVATPLNRATATLVPTPTPTTEPTPANGTPLPVSMTTTEARLLAAELPQRDIRLLAERLRKTGPIPEVVHETPPLYQIGDRHTFWVGNIDTMEQFQVTAVLRYETPHLYMWIEEGVSYDLDALARSAEAFENNTYPTNRAFFGSEWVPGVDNDPHLHILHSTERRMGSTVAGYYSSADEYSRLANPYSNEREMFYISLSGMPPGTSFYDGVLAHEFQHMIHWANDRNEETWMNEGCSELAAYLNGHDPGGFDWLFVADPDVQLTTWPEGGSSGAHYGGSYLFMAYFLGRFGEDVMKRVVAHPANGAAGFDAVLAEYGLTFDDVFADWLVANYVDNLSGAGVHAKVRHIYPHHVVGPVTLDATHDTYPVQRQSTVHQYAADYTELSGRGDLLITFRGDNQVKLVPEEAHSGQYAWWSNRGDDSDTRLTRAFDLRSLGSATLQVWMWYDIEEDWDYAYVEISTDGGQTWDVLVGPSSTTSDPNGNGFGSAYTGWSGGWIEERFDLTPHTGREVLLRFEYVTDDAVNRSGWLIDDIRIPELGYEDDFESGPGEWQADGFVYSDNRIAQRYRVQVVTMGRRFSVLPVPLDETQHGQVELRGLGQDIDSAVLIISAIAPVTTEVAAYEYTIQPIE
jgi:immune inhibitor A